MWSWLTSPWDTQFFGKRHRFQRQKMTLAAAHTADSVGDGAHRLVQGWRYEQWIACATVKRREVDARLSFLPFLPQRLGEDPPVCGEEQLLMMRRE